MAVVKRFEDLRVWQQAREVNRRVYEVTRVGKLAKDFALVDQMRRCSVSVMNNIAERFERYRRAEFLQFLSIAKGSAGELRSMLYAAADAGYLDHSIFTSLMSDATELTVAIGRFRVALSHSAPKPAAINGLPTQHPGLRTQDPSHA